MTREFWTSGVMAIVALAITGVALAAEEKPKLGVVGKVVDIGFGKGIGVDRVARASVAEGMGVPLMSFIRRLEVAYGEDKVDARRTDSFKALKEALDHKDVQSITVVWRKDGVWYKNTFFVKKKAFSGVKRIEDPDK